MLANKTCDELSPFNVLLVVGFMYVPLIAGKSGNIPMHTIALLSWSIVFGYLQFSASWTLNPDLLIGWVAVCLPVIFFNVQPYCGRIALNVLSNTFMASQMNLGRYCR